MATTPIAELEQRNAHALSKSIRAVVTLIWPYSSSTKQAALLLAEPDFRLRKSKGQVRVQLVGAAAEAVARSKISSGDEVILSLEGARWVEAVAASISTPGRSVEVELEYKRRIVCEIHRNGSLLKRLDVNDQTRSKPRSRSASPDTPYSRPKLLGTPHVGRVNGLSTPASSAFHRRARVVSGELVDSPYDPFANDTKAVGHDPKRQRMSWGSDARWTINDNVPSPSKRQARDDWVRDEDLQSPKKMRGLITPMKPTPAELSSPSQPRVADVETQAGTNRYAQELVDLVGGDTEEKDFAQKAQTAEAEGGQDGQDDEDAQAVKNAGSTILDATKFSVFRDTAPTSFFGNSRGAADRLAVGNEMVNQEIQLDADERQFFDLPSSDPARYEADQELVATEQPHLLETDSMVEWQAESHFQDDVEPLEEPSHVAESAAAPAIARLRIHDMPPPTLPALQTEDFDSVLSASMPPPPVSALPRSPRTPDIRPQHSAALPLPSPFPGEELSSYVDFSPSSVQGAFASPSAESSPVLPDWMLQIGFGFGSQGFLRDSPPKPTKEDSPAGEVQPTVRTWNPVDDSEGDPPTAEALFGPHNVEVVVGDIELPAVPTKSKVYPDLEEPDRTTVEETGQPGLGISAAVELSSPPQEASQPLIGSTTTHAIELSSDSSDVSEDDEEAPIHGSETQPAQPDDASVASAGDFDITPEDSAGELGADSIGSSQSEVDESEEGTEVGSNSEDREDAGTDENEGEPPSDDLPSDGLLQIQESDAMNLQDTGEQDDQVSFQAPEKKSGVGEIPTVAEKNFPAEQSPAVQSSPRSGISKRWDALQEVPTSSAEPEAFDLPDVGSLYEPSVPAQSGVTFAPRVTRQRAALHGESAKDLETQSSAPLANSQQQFQPPHLRIQDTFEGKTHSDGSLTTAPPSRAGDRAVLHPIGEDQVFDGSSTPIPALSPPHGQRPASFDGAYDEDVPFIASSPPLVPADSNDDVTYPALPFTEFETAQSHLDRFDTAQEIRQDGHSLFTPEASQLLTLDENEPLNDVHYVPQLPPTPHQTQVEQPFYDAIAGDESQDKHDPVLLSDPLEMPAKALSKLSSDPASSILSPWFGMRTARKNGARLPKEEEDIHATAGDAATQETATLRADKDFIDHGTITDAAHSTARESDFQELTQIATTQESINSQVVIDDFSFSQSQATQVRGLLTSISYYTPLSALFSCIRMPGSNSQSYNDGCVDVIAVVTKATTKPLRADKGQRDYYTKMSITDKFFDPKSLRVQVFRPWRAALPRADKGDVVLLRGFEVFSAKGNVGVGLKSAESAAWCVWRGRGEKHDPTGGDDVRPWTKRERVDTDEEDMRGPPVELGEQERQYARELKAWYQGVAEEDMSVPPVASL